MIAMAVNESKLASLIMDGLVWRAEFSRSGIAAAGIILLGFTTGANRVAFPSRSYRSDGQSMTVELFQTAQSSGAAVRHLNRRVGITAPPPFQIKADVTATPGTPITAAKFIAAASGGSAQAGIFGDANLLILEANTPYVLRLTNSGSGAAELAAAFDFYELVGL